MKSVQLSVLVALSLIFISFTSTAKKEQLRLELSKGQNYTYVITQENTLQEKPDELLMYQKMSLKISQTVMDRLPNGNYLIEASFKTFAIEFKNLGRIIRYHSDTVDVRNKLYKPLNFLTDIRLKYQVSPEGVVSKLTGFEPLKKKLEEDPQLPPMLRSFGNEQFLLELYNYIPGENVGVGSKWISPAVLPELLNHKYDIQYTFKEATDKELKIGHDASIDFSTEAPMPNGKTNLIKEKGTQKGTLTLDPKTRMRIASDITQEIEISTSQTKTNGQKIEPAKLINKTNIVRVKK